MIPHVHTRNHARQAPALVLVLGLAAASLHAQAAPPAGSAREAHGVLQRRSPTAAHGLPHLRRRAHRLHRRHPRHPGGRRRAGGILSQFLRSRRRGKGRSFVQPPPPAPFGSPWLGDWNSGAERAKVKDAMEARGLVMMWTIGWDSSDSLDWASGEWYEAKGPHCHPGGKSCLDKMAREDLRVVKRADGEASGIVLMHDTHQTSKDVLKELIGQLKAKGYSFATLADYAAWRWGEAILGVPAPR